MSTGWHESRQLSHRCYRQPAAAFVFFILPFRPLESFLIDTFLILQLRLSTSLQLCTFSSASPPVIPHVLAFVLIIPLFIQKSPPTSAPSSPIVLSLVAPSLASHTVTLPRLVQNPCFIFRNLPASLSSERAPSEHAMVILYKAWTALPS